MSVWRVIITDSESASGVAPVCTQARVPGSAHDFDPAALLEPARWDDHTVYNCCPHPHLETWSTVQAENLARALTEADAEVCS